MLVHNQERDIEYRYAGVLVWRSERLAGYSRSRFVKRGDVFPSTCLESVGRSSNVHIGQLDRPGGVWDSARKSVCMRPANGREIFRPKGILTEELLTILAITDLCNRIHSRFANLRSLQRPHYHRYNIARL